MYNLEGSANNVGGARGDLAIGCSNGDMVILSALGGENPSYHVQRTLKLRNQEPIPVGAICWGTQDLVLCGGRQDGSILLIDVASSKSSARR